MIYFRLKNIYILEAKITKLEKRFNNMVSSSQVTRFHMTSKIRTNSSFLENYTFRASKKIMVTTTSCIQITSRNMVSTTIEVLELLFGHSSNHRDLNTHI